MNVTRKTPGEPPVTVAVDGTEDGRRALRYGIELATAYGAPLRLVHVRHENVMLSPMLPLFPDLMLDEISEHVLANAVADARRLGWHGAAPETVLARAPRVPALVDSAHGSRFVVVGTRSSMAEHLLTGATSTGVAAHADAPVVCVPDRWDPKVRFRQVTVGVDGTPASGPLIEAAASVARVYDARVVVLHAWQPVGQYDAAIGNRVVAQRWEARARILVDCLVDEVRADHPDVKFEVDLRYQRPVVALHDLSQSSDLVVVGRHGDHGHHLRFAPMLGSTVRAVMRSSACPVLVVPIPPHA